MNHIDIETQQLKTELVEMWRLVVHQMKAALLVLAEFDKSKIESIQNTEKQVNELELKMDKACENIFALHNPVAGDLRLVLAMLRINTSLERIGDAAADVAKFVKKAGTFDFAPLLQSTQTLLMFEEANELLADVLDSFETENAVLALSIFKRDQTLNAMYKTARAIIIEEIKGDPQHVEDYLDLLTIIRKLERSGDQCKNIAEEIIFFVEAKVLKHNEEKYKGTSDSCK